VRLVEPGGHWCGRIAQLVEQLTLNQRAQGSSPCAPTNDFSVLYSILSTQDVQQFFCGPHADPAGGIRPSGKLRFNRYYRPSRHPLVFGPLPGFAGYATYLAPVISRRDEEGFSSCLGMSLSPCCRFHPAKVSSRIVRFGATSAVTSNRRRLQHTSAIVVHGRSDREPSPRTPTDGGGRWGR
jgi:hypothetical protein